MKKHNQGRKNGLKNGSKVQAPITPPPPASDQSDLIRVIFQQDGEEVDACEIDLDLHSLLCCGEIITTRSRGELLAEAIQQFAGPILARHKAGLPPAADDSDREERATA